MNRKHCSRIHTTCSEICLVHLLNKTHNTHLTLRITPGAKFLSVCEWHSGKFCEWHFNIYTEPLQICDNSQTLQDLGLRFFSCILVTCDPHSGIHEPTLPLIPISCYKKSELDVTGATLPAGLTCRANHILNVVPERTISTLNQGKIFFCSSLWKCFVLSN